MYVQLKRGGLALLLGLLFAPLAMADGMKIGLGRVAITPSKPVWMAGYASRTEPGSGKLHDLWTKAMAIEDGSGNKVVIVTADIIGFSLDMTDAVSKRIEDAYGIPRSNLLFNSSHTHCGPVVKNDGLHITYGLEGANEERAVEYTRELAEMVYQAIDASIKDLAPGTLSWGIGEAMFAKNRRAYGAGGVSNDFNPIGPVDHDVPVLLAKGADGVVRGVLFGYACHNTTLSIQEFNGDYAGFAQLTVEKAFPGATALFAQGCGGDQNPLPRREVVLAEKYGTELGGAVSAVSNGQMTPVDGAISARYKVIPLALSAPPTEAEVDAQLTSQDVYLQRRAKKLKAIYAEKGALPTSLPYVVQVIKLGNDVQITALSGEVTVDYSLLIKYHYPRHKQFVMGYSNDCPAYIPSLRVLKEGGYEGGDSMVYYGVHGPWAPSIEEDIMKTIHELAKAE
ncbi:MAG: neutral/alkaline non-lysosomal ceramidase N-terminal domain-containing protein [Candidatus Hydrogenedentes bacterium]|nr:neutral/alkaline non-lysosomal ceramidase N-terminal domain-containing protein [Candidatus Hydrogenedentota bacterium]